MLLIWLIYCHRYGDTSDKFGLITAVTADVVDILPMRKGGNWGEGNEEMNLNWGKGINFLILDCAKGKVRRSRDMRMDVVLVVDIGLVEQGFVPYYCGMQNIYAIKNMWRDGTCGPLACGKLLFPFNVVYHFYVSKSPLMLCTLSCRVQISL